MELCAFAATLPRIRALTQDFSANCLVVDCRAPVAPIASHGPTRIPPLGVVSPGQRVTALRERLMMRKCTLVRDERRTAPIPHGTNRAGDVAARAPQPTRGLRCRVVFRGALWPGALLLSMAGESHAQTGPYAYLPSTVSNTVSVIDIPTNTVEATIPTGARGFHPVVSGDQSVV